MPRVASLSVTTTASPIRRRPSAGIVARFRPMWLIVLFAWVTRSLPAIAGASVRGCGLARDPGPDRDAAAVGDLGRRVEAAERLDRRPRHVDGVGRAVGLRQDVAHAGGLEHGAHGPAGDDAGAERPGLQPDAARPRPPPDLAPATGP